MSSMSLTDLLTATIGYAKVHGPVVVAKSPVGFFGVIELVLPADFVKKVAEGLVDITAPMWIALWKASQH